MAELSGRKAIAVALTLCAVLCGCAGTKWVCGDGASCLPRSQASNRCLAQANSAFSRNKSTIWEQCMRGEGYEEAPCSQGELGRDPECQVMHVY